MVSHCVPNAIGDVDRARAWQLLRLVSQSHNVYLVCLLDNPVNLAQWRTVNDQSHQFVIDTAKLPHHRQWWKTLIGGQKPGLRLPHGRLARLIDHGWTGQSFDAILCTHPILLEQIESISTPKRICDLNLDTYPNRPKLQWNQLFDPQHAATKVDLVILSHANNENSMPTPIGKTMVLPLRIDPDFFRLGQSDTANPSDSPPPSSVVVHCQWQQRSATAAMKWFMNQIWPSVMQAAPETRLSTTQFGAHDDPYITLDRATIVVCPDPNPQNTQLQAWQAMAMRKPMIAFGSVIDQLKLTTHPDTPMLLGHREHDWIEYCIHLLRSAKMRMALANSAGQWINHYPTIEQSGHQLTQILSGAPVKPKPISLAA